ncbi:tRNA dimethylallyltransferase 2 isoform X1 [Ananas comosus]|uniref:tRNA dimethylallyltransferase 2 isoform X1 n=1 Tax=Ananas comosus TaxID=4615 RepID=A0A6P5GXF2_ANACO|nr:tRNA dimethylallyltransferase 2 isoform X1 [Ananas comosus]
MGEEKTTIAFDGGESAAQEKRRKQKQQKKKGAVVVVMGATGAGKSRLAIDLASVFPGVEVVNADSMQVYHGLDVVTNKPPPSDRNGVPHHLLGMIDASMEFTSRDFRNLAIPIIDDILSRNGLPVIVGGTNYYIQALVSPFLVDDVLEDLHECSVADLSDLKDFDVSGGYERLKEIDPVAANRIHPNDQRKINRYLSLHASSGALPSNLYRGKAAEKWGRVSNFRYNCFFIWLDASLPVLDRYVDQRVDCMIDSGLLNEVRAIYNPSAVYTRGLFQAIGIREFNDFFQSYFANKDADLRHKLAVSDVLNSNDDKLKNLLNEAIGKLKANTRKLVRRQRRRLHRLKKDFGWDLNYIDATKAFFCEAGDIWHTKIVGDCVDLLRTFLCENASSLACSEELGDVQSQVLVSKDLWTQYICEACGNRILRGAHEWEQHKRGKGHRKRISGLKKTKSLSSYMVEQMPRFTNAELPANT